jgi:ABC-type glycerol-3-phosphate transport system permease component
MTIQLILQLKIFDQVYLFSQGGRPNNNMVLVYYVFQRAFQQNQGGRAAAVAVVLFVVVSSFRCCSSSCSASARGGGNDGGGAQRWNFWGGVITAITVVCALIWAFPLYWGVISSVKPEDQVVRPYIELWPETLTFQHYVFALTATQIGTWYVNSVAVAVGVTVITVFTSMLCGYAISQLRFPGRAALWFLILASFMVPTQALIINHFVLVAQLGLINTWAGIMLPQLIHPVIIIVYKQFFDQVPRDFREAAVMDNASEFAILFKVYRR